jgi:plastocyanin
MRRGVWVTIVATVAVVTLLGAACSSNDNSGASSASGGGGGGSTSTQTSGGGGGEGGSSGSADVVAEDFDFSPSTVSAKSGSSITVKNDTPSTPHTFTVDGTKIDQSLDPDTTVTVKVALDPGSYDFHCTIHPQMTGTLTVT